MPWSPDVTVPPLTFVGTRVALASIDDVAGLRMAWWLVVDDKADRRHRWERRGSGQGRAELGHGLLGQLARGREEGEEEGLGCGCGPKRREGRERAQVAFPIF